MSGKQRNCREQYESTQDLCKKSAEAIRHIREENGLSQESFAERIGVERGTVSTWERGLTPISSTCALMICSEFGCDTDYIFGRMDYKTRDLKFLCEQTGLSEDAITKIISWKNSNDRSGLFVDYLSQMIEDTRFDELMGSFLDMVSSAKCWRKSYESNQRYGMEQERNNYVAYQFDLAKNVTSIADSIVEKEIRG